MAMAVIVKGLGVVVPGLGLVKLPQYMSRSNAAYPGWTVRDPSTKKMKWFGDGKYGGVIDSMNAALDYVHEVSDPNFVQNTRFHTVEAKNKATPLEVGISFHRIEKDHAAQYQFCVSTPGLGSNSTTIYIGTENTWTSNYDSKLEEARQLREEALTAYQSKKLWKGLSTRLYA